MSALGAERVQRAARRRVGGGGPWASFAAAMRRAAGIRTTQIGLLLVAAVVAVALLGPLLAPYSPTQFVGPPFKASAPGTLFGTDNLGRDVFSRFLYGGRTVVVSALVATVLGVGVGTLVGVTAAYRGGLVDDGLMRASDVVMAFPQVLLVLLLVAGLGTKLWLVVLTVALGHVPRTARVTRGAALEITQRDFIKAAEAMGERSRRIIAREILPNIAGSAMVEFSLRLSYSIGLIAGVSFLGFGLQPPAADWGLMISENRVGITQQPWAVVLPVVGIATFTVGAGLITDGVARVVAGLDRGERR